jgi:hypothetical protein
MDHPNPRRKILPYRLTLLISVVLSCVLMNLVTIVFQAEIFDFWSWTTLIDPPAGVTTIVAARPNQVWVETQDGSLFMNEVDFSCPGDFTICYEWISVSDLSEIPQQAFSVRRGDNCKNLRSDIALRILSGKMVECVYAFEVGAEYGDEGSFALTSDGSILYFYKARIWMTSEILFIFSTFIFPIIVAIIVSVVYLVISIIRQAFRKARVQFHE